MSSATAPAEEARAPAGRAHAGQRRVLRRRGRAHRAVPRDGRALRPRRTARRRAHARRALDARHVAVEFVHPGDRRQARAAGDRAGRRGEDPTHQLALLAEPGDIVIAFGAEPAALALARERGCLTIMSRATTRSGRSCRQAMTRSCTRSSPRRSTTSCGSSCTCSSSTAACSRGVPPVVRTTPARRPSCTRSWPSARTTSTPCSTTSGARCCSRPRRSARCASRR